MTDEAKKLQKVVTAPIMLPDLAADSLAMHLNQDSNMMMLLITIQSNGNSRQSEVAINLRPQNEKVKVFSAIDGTAYYIRGIAYWRPVNMTNAVEEVKAIGVSETGYLQLLGDYSYQLGKPKLVQRVEAIERITFDMGPQDFL